MGWSWKIARFAAIDVYIHATFPLLVAWFGYTHWLQYGTLSAALDGMLFIVILFGCVVLHEFGHALTARRFGIRTQRITLYPIGGVASMEKMPEQPLAEMKVALAGPLVNLVIAGLLWLWIRSQGIQVSEEELMTTGGPLPYRIMLVNIALALFNLTPAFPMDGGRVLRAALALRLPHPVATRKAAALGQTFAIVLGLLGIFHNPFLLLIAVFLWFAAQAENTQEQLSVALKDITARDAMLTNYAILSPHDTLARAIELTLAGGQKDFPVGSPDHFNGVLTQSGLLSALRHYDEQSPIALLELEPMATIDAKQRVSDLISNPLLHRHPLLAVTDSSGRIMGILNSDNIMELIRIQDAMQQHLFSDKGIG